MNTKFAMIIRQIVNVLLLETFCTFMLCNSTEFDGSSKSYGKFSSWIPCRNGSISLEFKTRESDGLLFYMGIEEQDYYMLKLIHGMLHLQFRHNSDMSTLSAGFNLGNGSWHKVKISRDGRLTSVRVDEFSYTRENSNYDSNLSSKSRTNANSKEQFLYIGGVPESYKDGSSGYLYPTLAFGRHLKGSIRNLVYSNCGKGQVNPVLLESEGIVPLADECLKVNPCQHEGICVTRDNGVHCDCSYTDYSGEYCEKEQKQLGEQADLKGLEKEERLPAEAMFQGTEYMMYDLTMRGSALFSRGDELKLHFKTTQPDGLLFYTGDGKDYMTLFLEAGSLHVAMDLGSGSYKKAIDMDGYKLDDGQWHSVIVKRISRRIHVTIDGMKRETGTTLGEFAMLSSNVLYLGGGHVPDSNSDLQIRPYFRGCMKKVEYIADDVKLELIELGKADHDLLSVFGDIVYGKCQDVVESRPITFTTPDSFIALPRWDLRKNNGTISFQFRTLETNGLLMYNGGQFDSSKLDFFAFEIIDGHFYLVLDLGTGAVKEKVSRKSRVDDGSPHNVFFQYSGRRGFIRVDSHETDYTTPGIGTTLDLEDLLYIGGINFERYNMYRLPKEVWAGVLRFGYVGCLQDLKINNQNVDLLTVATKQQQKEIIGDCRRIEPQCSRMPCLHQGLCSEGWNRFVCDCRSTGYTGRTCDQVAATLAFDGTQYVFVSLPKESSTEAEDISLRFWTEHENGLLLITMSQQSADSIEIALERGSIKLTISIGIASKTLSIGHNLHDRKWHTVFVKRRGQNMELWVDNSRPVADIIPNIATNVKVKEIVLGSVGPLISDVDSDSMSALTFDDIPHNINLQRDDIQHHQGFIGNMQQFLFNGNHFFDMAQAENVERIEVTASFDNGESITRDAITFKSRDSYVSLPQLLKTNSVHFSVSFKFKTTEPTGLVLYTGGFQTTDFLALELYDGYLFYVYNMGGGSKRIQINTPDELDDNKWHDVTLVRSQLDQQMIHVDSNSPTVEDMKGYSARRFDLKGPLYAGGIGKTWYNSLPTKVTSRYGFQGCLASLSINSERVNILEAASLIEYSVVQGCTSVETCHVNSCYNEGRCIPQWPSFTCDCDLTSYQGKLCTERGTTYEFGLRKGLIWFEHPDDTRPSTNSDYLAFGLTTIQNKTKLIRVDSEDTDDFIEIELLDGNIYAMYNMGQATHPIYEMSQKVNDGKYHVIKFIRLGANATLQVDKARSYKNPIGKQMKVFNNQTRLWIGGRMSSRGIIEDPFFGTISGLVFNGIHVLKLLDRGDPRVKIEGDVKRKFQIGDSILHPQKVEIQSTEGMKLLRSRRRRSRLKDNTTRKQTNLKSFMPKYYREFKNLISRDENVTDLSKKDNSIGNVETRARRQQKFNIIENRAKLDEQRSKKGHSEGNVETRARRQQKYNIIENRAKLDEQHLQFIKDSEESGDDLQHFDNDHILTGPANKMIRSDFSEHSMDNIETDASYSGFSLLVGDTEQEGWDSDIVPGALVSGAALDQKQDTSGGNLNTVQVGPMHTYPFAAQNAYQIESQKGKKWENSLQFYEMLSKKHFKKSFRGTTPKHKSGDEIIFSGEPPDCFNIDEEKCIPTDNDEGIIVPTTVITRLSTPKPVENTDATHNKNATPANTRWNTSTAPNLNNTVPPTPTMTPREIKDAKDSAHLNIFLIIGIAAGGLVALIILVIALYKFRSRDEGSYRVDETQNFAYLEAKKQQSNGAAVNSMANGKAGGKKKDVKEWYV